MIPQAEGEALVETLQGNGGPEQGALVPMNCKKDSGVGDKNQQCHAAVKSDRELVEGLVLVSTGGGTDVQRGRAAGPPFAVMKHVNGHGVNNAVSPYPSDDLLACRRWRAEAKTRPVPRTWPHVGAENT